jgi:hypothetical protein
MASKRIFLRVVELGLEIRQRNKRPKLDGEE